MLNCSNIAIETENNPFAVEFSEQNSDSQP